MSEHATDGAPAARPGGAGLAAALGGLALAGSAAVALWASEGPRVFVETAFSAVLACI